MGKGSRRRPRSITREEEELRWAYAKGEINYTEFVAFYAKLEQDGLIHRSGQILK